MVKQFTIGADPEFMLVENGAIRSAIGIVQGTKDKPFKLDNGAGLQTDNVAVEFATPVCTSEEEFVSSISFTMGLIQRQLPIGYGLKSVPSAIFPDKELEHPQAQEFGCSPDYNCYTLQRNPIPQATDKALRSFGGHVHIGYVEGSGYKFLLSKLGKATTVRMCDLFLGITSVVLDDTHESRQRRNLYGKAGCYRPTSYGVEYRVLSNFWTENELLIRLVYSLVTDVLNWMYHKRDAFHLLNQFDSEKVQQAINESDSHMAKQKLIRIKEYMGDKSLELLNQIERG